ncbi:MarR family transcriptional regulator [Paucibacter sp. Y2R2-4]|nr:MarR family transcriptional regulator [Paucibacter sp. Y2R2-4]
MTSSDTMMQLDQQLCFALYASSLAMTKAYKPLLEPLGLTYPQYLVMLVLWESDGIHVSQLGERLSLDSGTLTPLLKRMESNGWLRRQRAQEDERRVEVFLTEHGQSLKAAARPIPGILACASDCSLKELQELTQRLHQLKQQMQSFLNTDRSRDTRPA